MAGKGMTAGKAIKYAVKYGPQVIALAKVAQEPAKAAAQKAYDGMRAKRAAFAQADTVADGSVLKVIRGDQPVWVVYSGDEVVGSHPDLGVGHDALLAHADLTKRVRPGDVPSTADRVRGAIPGRKRS